MILQDDIDQKAGRDDQRREQEEADARRHEAGARRKSDLAHETEDENEDDDLHRPIAAGAKQAERRDTAPCGRCCIC